MPFGADWRPTLLGRVLLILVLPCRKWRYPGYILQLNIPWYLEDRAAGLLRQFLLPQFLWEKKAYEELDNYRLTNLLLVGK